MKVGQLLFTRDGRYTGNAIVTAVEEVAGLPPIYHCRTDFGNEIAMTAMTMAFNFHVDPDSEYDPKLQLDEQIEKLNKLKESK